MAVVCLKCGGYERPINIYREVSTYPAHNYSKGHESQPLVVTVSESSLEPTSFDQLFHVIFHTAVRNVMPPHELLLTVLTVENLCQVTFFNTISNEMPSHLHSFHLSLVTDSQKPQTCTVLCSARNMTICGTHFIMGHSLFQEQTRRSALYQLCDGVRNKKKLF